MSTISYSKVNTVEKQKQYLSKKLDRYAKFYWRGEDMWETYNTFITNNGSALKFVNGPSFSNEYSSPQYDHAMGNLTGVKFTRMQVSFSICTYGVTAEKYRSLVDALGPYEIDYLAFEYDSKLCYLAKTTGMKEAVKTVIGVDDNGKDLYMVENSITFEIQGEQCALAQRQYVWTSSSSFCPTPQSVTIDGTTKYVSTLTTNVVVNQNDMLTMSEKPFGVVGEIRITPINIDAESQLELYITGADSDINNGVLLCNITFNKITTNWQNTQVNNAASDQPTSFQNLDGSFSIKYDSSSGLVFMQYGESDYKVLNLLLTNTYGEYLVKEMSAIKMKIDKQEIVENVHFIWKLTNFSFINTNYLLELTTVSNDNQSCRIKEIKIGETTYTFGTQGNYSSIPNLHITGEVRDDGNTSYTHLVRGGKISISIPKDTEVIVTPYVQNEMAYRINEQDNFTQMSTSTVNNLPFTMPKRFDASTAQLYGRAKAILV